jgi:ferredoxin
VLTVLHENPPAELLEKVRLAERYCPTNAITLVEED